MNFECSEKQCDLLVAGLQHIEEQAEDALSRIVGSGIATARDRRDLAKERDSARNMKAVLTGQPELAFS